MRPINSLLGLFAFYRWLIFFLILAVVFVPGAMLMAMMRAYVWAAKGLVKIGNRIAP
jgi:hypothetical protein